jgi:hypothetical protein
MPELGSRTREAIVIAAVLAPVALHPARRRLYGQLEPRRRLALGAMVGASLAGHLVVGSRAFPFVDWSMYTSPVSGDPVVVEYDAVRRSGARAPLSPSRFLGAQSAGRLMEALRRQVLRIQSLQGAERNGVARQHELTLRAIAAWDERHRRGEDPIVAVVVSERTVSLGSGQKSSPRTLWQIELA